MAKNDGLKPEEFDVDSEQLAHDLTLLKLGKDTKLTGDSDESTYYQAYVQELAKFTKLIDERSQADDYLKFQ